MRDLESWINQMIGVEEVDEKDYIVTMQTALDEKEQEKPGVRLRKRLMRYGLNEIERRGVEAAPDQRTVLRGLALERVSALAEGELYSNPGCVAPGTEIAINNPVMMFAEGELRSQSNGVFLH